MQIIRTDIPRTGKTVDVGQHIPARPDDLRETLEVLSEDEVFDEGLFSACVDLAVHESLPLVGKLNPLDSQRALVPAGHGRLITFGKLTVRPPV